MPLSARQMEYLALAWQCFETEPKVRVEPFVDFHRAAGLLQSALLHPISSTTLHYPSPPFPFPLIPSPLLSPPLHPLRSTTLHSPLPHPLPPLPASHYIPHPSPFFPHHPHLTSFPLEPHSNPEPKKSRQPKKTKLTNPRPSHQKDRLHKIPHRSRLGLHRQRPRTHARHQE